MNLTELRSLLTQHQDKAFHLQLPRGETVPVAFHVTEVAHVAKKFIDCGGRLHTEETVQLQAWVGEDEDHRLTTTKLLGIIGKSEQVVLPAGAGELPVTVEYEDGIISQYPLESSSVAGGVVLLHLGVRHTDCLAKDICLPPSNFMPLSSFGVNAGSCCTPGGKCC
jgi:hypothetical protein